MQAHIASCFGVGGRGKCPRCAFPAPRIPEAYIPDTGSQNRCHLGVEEMSQDALLKYRCSWLGSVQGGPCGASPVPVESRGEACPTPAALPVSLEGLEKGVLALTSLGCDL